MRRTVPRTCNVCEAMCGLLLTVDDDRIVDVRGDDDDPFSRGHICPKGPAMREVHEDPDRLRHPLRRTATGWERISWDAALDEAATRLRDLQRRHGRDAVAVYLGNPTVHNHGAALYTQIFLRALATRNRFDANSMDANPKLFSSLQMFGDITSVPVPDVDRTDFLLMLGANPAASNGSLMSLGDVRGRMKGIRERGGKVVLLDPRRTESAGWADEHVFIRPGGDAAFLLGLLHVLFAENFVVDERVARRADGLPALRALAARFTPERVSPACGVAPAKIRELARAFARAPRAVCYGRVGTSVNEFGCEASWLLDVVNVVTGNIDRPGGAMWATPPLDLGGLGRLFGLNEWGRHRSRVRGLPEFGGQLPIATLADEIETPGDGQVRGMVTIAGNPALSAPNGGRLARAIAGLDFFVAIDLFVNETSRHAHLILPPRYSLERPHIDVVLPQFAVRNIVKYSETALPPADDTRDDWEILDGLTRRLVGPLARLMPRLHPDRIVDLALRLGKSGLSLAKVRRHPHGLDLGALRPAWRERVRTPNRRVQLMPAALVDGLDRLERHVAGARGAGLLLIGRRHLRSNNSWMHNCHSLVKGPDRATLLMHPSDVAAAGASDGQDVRITSRAGELVARIEQSDSIMPGVVSLPHGYGHAAAKDTLRVAGALPGASVNLVTDETLVEPILGTAILNGVPVTVVPMTPTTPSPAG